MPTNPRFALAEAVSDLHKAAVRVAIALERVGGPADEVTFADVFGTPWTAEGFTDLTIGAMVTWFEAEYARARGDASPLLNEQIKALASEACKAGDVVQVALCHAAFGGDVEARVECARVIDAARATHLFGADDQEAL